MLVLKCSEHYGHSSTVTIPKLQWTSGERFASGSPARSPGEFLFESRSIYVISCTSQLLCMAKATRYVSELHAGLIRGAPFRTSLFAWAYVKLCGLPSHIDGKGFSGCRSRVQQARGERVKWKAKVFEEKRIPS